MEGRSNSGASKDRPEAMRWDTSPQETRRDTSPGGNDTGYQSDMGHGRTHSLAPLLGAVGGAATGAAVYAAASTANRDNNNNGGSRPGSSGRPSTGGSSKPLITPGPSPQAYGPQQGYGTQTYPPQSQGYSRTSYYGSSDHNHTATAYNPSLNTNPSVGSSSWGGGSSSSYAAPQPHVGMMAPLVAGAAPPAMNRPQSFDQDGRSGSPVSIQEQRVLQVINPDTGLASSPPQGASALASPTSPIGGSSSGHRTNPSVDGKGRPIDTRGQFVPIVHLDGGVYEEPPRNVVAGRSNDPLPPAYSS
ncbi:hypothetical protein FA13DRAFT_17745 [Coprinellus micaceus]|uniref:Uncharacterized protein n=1 Tax=Coprinellus micaceus TaxID=71717 RepID=A0A4Y7TZR8_COPMI|nr:hypothetical protein FA13DRAFT_17745 [Coprinellus micaceus]